MAYIYAIQMLKQFCEKFHQVDTKNYISESNTTKINTLFYRRFGFTSEAFIRTDFRCRSSVCVPYVAQLVAPLVSIHVVGLPDPYRLPYESASFAWFSINHLGVCPVYHMILTANMICECRFVADTGCPGLFCSSKDFCDTIHFFTMFFYSCSQWPSVSPT